LKRTISVLAVLMMLSGAAVNAMANEVSIFGGTPIPHGKTDGGLYGQKKWGWQVGVGYTMPLQESLFLRLEGVYGQIPNAVDYDWLSPMKVLEGSVNLKIRTCDRYSVKPYVLMGMGLAEINVLVDHASVEMTSSSTEMTLRVGLGLDVVPGDGEWGLFVEGMAWESYYLSLVPVRAGVRLSL
jgi:opacity protein-like surface antigen